MQSTLPVVLDGEGGDHFPVATAKAAATAARDYGIPVIITGNDEVLRRLIEQEPRGTQLLRNGMIEICHASDEPIAMSDNATSILRKGRSQSSMALAFQLVIDGKAIGVASAGHSGSMMSAATMKLGRIPGLDRPAIASFFPSAKGKVVLLDAGSNTDSDAHNLIQWAQLGSAYAEYILARHLPEVRLLSIGEEATKGDKLIKATHADLLAAECVNFCGNIEGKGIFKGLADVVVCDGYGGNTTLKVTEGVAEFIGSILKDEVFSGPLGKLAGLMLYSRLKRMKAKLDYAEYGGAPLLGVNGIVIICHGRSNARALVNAIRLVQTMGSSGVIGALQQIEFYQPAPKLTAAKQ